MKKKLIAFGEVLWDVYPDEKFIGGAPLNFAAHFVKGGAESYLLSAVGDDELGEDTLRAVNSLSVGTEYISVKSGIPTGRCNVTLDADMHPHYELLSGVAYDFIDAPKTRVRFDAFYFGTLALRSEYNRSSLIKALDVTDVDTVIVDVNIRPPYDDAQAVNFALSRADILKISDEELPIVLEKIGIESEGGYGDICRRICEKFSGVKIILLTLGDKGAFAYSSADGNEYRTDAVKVTAVSTVGAGDSFAAGFLSKYLCGNSIEEALDYATRISSYVVSRKEAIPDYPDFL